jgi:hypothetical protein
MGDEGEYVNADELDTPTAADLDAAYGSRFLGVSDVGTRKIRTKILRVRKEKVKDRDTGREKVRFVLSLAGLDKQLLLNTTNKNAIVDALGKNPADWIGGPLGIFVDPNVVYGANRGGVRIRVLTSAVKPKAAPPPDDFEPDLNDPVPDFR